MRKTTLKVAELATIIYAILVLMSLILDNAYYSQFNIPIVSYMSGSEILLSCVQQFLTPSIMVYAASIVCCFVLVPIIYRAFYKKPYSINNTIPSHDEITAKYNTASVIIVTLSLIASIFIYTQFPDALIFGLVWTSMMYLYCIFPKIIPDKFKYFKSETNKFSDNILREHKERFYDINYRYRLHIFAFACLLSVFFIMLKVQYYKAKEVKEKGNGVCVLLEGDGINIDTREGTIDYIGECAGNIFLYDHETQGTIIYERSQILNYKLITDYIAKANVKYDRYAEQVQADNRHVGTNLLQRINAEAPLTNIFTFTIPDNYVLTQQDNNYYVWEDSVTHAYIEQLNLPKRFFDNKPSATDIFNLDIYVMEGGYTDNPGLCSTTLNTYTGKGGELVQTIIADGDHYAAWLFYSPTERHDNIAGEFMKSMRLKGNVWQQMAIIYRANESLWNIIAIIMGISFLICFYFGCVSLTSDDQKAKKEPKSEKKKFSDYLGIYLFIIFEFAFFFVPLISLFASSHRWPVILTCLGLTLLTMIVLFVTGIIIAAIIKRDKNKDNIN